MGIQGKLLYFLLIQCLLSLDPSRGLASPDLGNGKLFAILIQVDSYGDGLELREPFSLERSHLVMKDAIEKLGRASGYKEENVHICEVLETKTRTLHSQAGAQKVSGSLPQKFCRLKSVGNNAPQPPQPITD